MKKTLLAAGLAALFLSAAGSAAAQPKAAWLDDDLTVRKEITLKPGTGGAGLDARTATFPFMLRLSPQTVAFDQMKPDGSDLRVAGPKGERVDHYVENFDAKAGLATVWVKGTDLDPSGSQTYHLYYGGDVPSTANAAAVFDASDILALDFTGTGPAKDRTRNNNAATSVPTAAGFAGQSASFTGAETLRVTASSSLNIASRPFTFMLWVKPSAPSAGQLVSREGSFSIGLNGLAPVATVGGVQIAASAPLTAGSWSHLALVARPDGRIELYVNGKLAGSGQAALPAQAGDIAIGQGFAGQIDNVRFAAADRSAGYVGAVAKSENGRGLVTFGAEEENAGHFQVGYFVTVIKSVTLEGWIVIALCGVLLVLALIVMIEKFGTVGKIERQNRAFEKVYATAPRLENEDLAGTATRNDKSTLGELYQAGMQEIANHSKDGVAVFSSSAIEALRARIDAVASNRAYSLSERLVILTLSIAGGPFLGLLGTVIGVMITFAAIAAEGNVNVNSIAPGVAAALLATAAGLIVAIPALFGYNLILTRIKRINATNRSFADMLVARIADHYGA
jgi:biopolymer transport protein ExbB